MRKCELILERFHRNYVIDEYGCWIFQIGQIKNGYCMFTLPGGKKIYAHRFSWEIHNGPIPDGMFVLHHCDTPPCVNPECLFLGTQTENLADMTAKGRRYTHPIGTKFNKKGKSDINRAILDLRRQGVRSNRV